ncbi:SPRY domain-containing protein 3 [Exaiptasia diaphana]|nr:SPRY domain-containing protein 3 [Exaiptasia diaphana]
MKENGVIQYRESPEEKILKRNQRLLRQIVREVYSEETKLNERCDWEIVNKARTVLMENQRMYILKCDNCDKAENIQKQCIHSVRYKHKLSEETPGFEVLIEFAGTKRRFGIGLTSKWYGNRYPGWREDSVGYHADTGRIHDKESHQFGRQLGASIQAIDPFPYTGDMIGCNVKFDDKKDDEYLVQFTRNRRLVGEARAKPDNLFPFVTMAYPEIKLLFRFVKKGESGFKNNTELSNQNEVDRLSKEIGVIKEICLRQNEKMEHPLSTLEDGGQVVHCRDFRQTFLPNLAYLRLLIIPQPSALQS